MNENDPLEIEQPKEVVFSCRLSDSEAKEFKRVYEALDLKISAALRVAIKDFIKNRGKKIK